MIFSVPPVVVAPLMLVEWTRGMKWRNERAVRDRAREDAASKE